MRSTGLRTRLAGRLVWRRLPPAAGRSVLLTFDDGPEPGVTETVLELLDRHAARAAFFVIGARAVRHPHLVRAIHAAGHVLGNHGFSHDMGHWPSPSRYLADLDRCSEAIASACGQPPVVFRAPGGRIHWASIMSPRRRNLAHVLWSIDPRDYRCPDVATSRHLGEAMTAVVQPRDIVLLHDSVATTPALLENLLPGIRARDLVLDGFCPPLPGETSPS